MKSLFSGVCFVLIFVSSCNIKSKEIYEYHKFDYHSWQRFDKVIFSLPIEEVNKPYDIYFFARHSKSYEFDNLDFGMIMNTPAGEERINQYSFKIKDTAGNFISKCYGDSCVAEIALKRGIFFSQKGTLKIEIEALVPRLEIKELFGVGIRLVPGS